MVSTKLDGAIIDCGGYNSLTNLAPSTANGEPIVHQQLHHVDLSEIPLVTWTNATTVSVGAGAAICRSIVDSNSKRLWNRPLGMASVSAALPGGVAAGATVYLFACTNGTGDSPSDSAFFSTTNPPNNTPTGFNWVRHIASFALNGSAQLNQFLMDGERWITANFASETFIPGAGWASKVIPGCPLGSVEVFGIVSSGLAVSPSDFYIKTSLANPTTISLAIPVVGGFYESTFNSNLAGSYRVSTNTIVANTDNFFGVTENRLLWHYKLGGAILFNPTLRMIKYRTVLKVLS